MALPVWLLVLGPALGAERGQAPAERERSKDLWNWRSFTLKVMGSPEQYEIEESLPSHPD